MVATLARAGLFRVPLAPSIWDEDGTDSWDGSSLSPKLVG